MDDSMAIANTVRKFKIKYFTKSDVNSELKKLNIVSFPTVIVFNPLNREYRFQIGYNEENNIGEIRKLIDSVK